MNSAFSWIGKIFDALLQIFPSLFFVRATEKGVRWSLWKEPVKVDPGLRLYWPLITDVEIVIAAKQTLNTPSQALMTKDRHTVVVGGVIVYKIDDIIKAIGKENWDSDDTAGDIAQAAIVNIVSKWGLNELLENISGRVEEQLTKACREQLKEYGISVHRAALTDFSEATQLNHTGINIMVSEEE